MFKVVKVFLKNSAELQGQEIYCVRLDYDEDFEDLKNKIFERCPQLKNQEPQIYWFDLENDKIRITCDDDLKFFMEESPCHKIIFNFGQQFKGEASRKRANSIVEDVDTAKKIRKQLQQIDLSSESSAMETDDDDASVSMSSSSIEDMNETAQTSEAAPDATLTVVEAGPSTSSAATETPESPNVQVLSVEIIRPADVPETIEIPNDQAANAEVLVVADDPVVEESAKVDENLQQSSPRKKPTNHIVISDSSDDEPEEPDYAAFDRRHSADSEAFSRTRRPDGPSATAYSYSSARSGNRFQHSANYCNRERDQTHRFYPRGRKNDIFFQQSFLEHRREFQRRQSENLEIINENVRMARNHAARAVRVSTAAIPDLISLFRSHFRYRPMQMGGPIPGSDVFDGR